MKTKILFVINSVQVGGAERQILYFLKFLDRDRFVPHLVLFRTIGREEELIPGDVGITVCPLSWNPFRLIHGIFRYAGAVLRIRPKYIVSHMWRTNLLSILIGKLTRTPVIATEHIHTVHSLSEVGMAPLWSLVIRFIYPLAHTILPVSTDVAKGLVETFGINPSRINVIQNGVDIAHVREMAAKEKPDISGYVVACGRLAPQKGYDMLIEAVSGIPGAQLVIVGEGPLRDELTMQASALGVSLRLPGHVENPYAWLRSARVCAVTSLFEGFSCVVLEAMACGIPVISVECTGIRDIITDNETGVIVPGRELKSFRDALSSLLKDSERIERLASGAARRIEDFDIRKILKRHEELYLQEP